MNDKERQILEKVVQTLARKTLNMFANGIPYLGDTFDRILAQLGEGNFVCAVLADTIASREDMLDTICQLEQEADELTQIVGELYRERDQAKAEYAWLSSRTRKPTRFTLSSLEDAWIKSIPSNNEEQSAMKINLEMKDVIIGGEVVVSNLTVNAEVPDEMLDLFSTVVKNMVKPRKHTCTCRDGDEDKRPSAIIRPRAKSNHENDFMPGDMD